MNASGFGHCGEIHHFSRKNMRPAGHFVAKSPHAQLCQEVGLGWAHGFSLLTLGRFRMANASNPNKKTEDATEKKNKCPVV